MNQLDFRVRPDGVIEYRHQQGASNKRGYWELWEPVAIHAARNMRIPGEYLTGLRGAGYTGGVYLIDLLNAEGWLVEKEEYLELEAKPVLESGACPCGKWKSGDKLPTGEEFMGCAGEGGPDDCSPIWAEPVKAKLESGVTPIRPDVVARQRGLAIARGHGNPQHTMSAETLLSLLYRVKQGEDPDQVYADCYSAPNNIHEHP